MTARIITGPLPPTVALTVWSDVRTSTGGKDRTFSLHELVVYYERQARQIKCKENLPAPVFATVRAECTPETCDKAAEDNRVLRRHRCDDAVVSCTALALDHDTKAAAPGVSWDGAVELCRELGLAAVFYESPSHMIEHAKDKSIGPRWRMIVFITTAWTEPSEWSQAYNRVRVYFESRLGLKFDPTTGNPSRVFYGPTRPFDTVAPRRVLRVDGAAIDLPATVATLPEYQPPPSDEPEPERFIPRGDPSPPTAIEQCRAYLQECEPAIDGSYGSRACFHAAQACVRGYELTEYESLELLRDVYNPRCHGPWSERELRHKLASAIRRGRMVRGSLLAPTPEPTPAPTPEPEKAPLQRFSDVLGGAVDARLVVPPGYALRQVNGHAHELELFRVTEGGDGRRVAFAPIWIRSELSAPTGNMLELGAMLDGKRQVRTVPRALLRDEKALAKLVEGSGIPLATGRNVNEDFAAYLSITLNVNRHNLPRRNARESTGWDTHFTSFLYGTDCIGAETEALSLPPGSGAVDMIEALRTAGDVRVWRDTANELISASPAAALALAAALASPMLRVFGWAVVGLMFAAEGGDGKSTVMRLGLSAFGSTGDGSSRQLEGIAGNGNATLLALPGQFAHLDDLPHFADEVKVNTRDPRTLVEIEAALHMLVDGQSRAGMRRDSTLRKVRRSHGCVALATETDAAEFLHKTGVNRRYPQLKGPYAADPGGRLNAALCANYGHAGRALVEKLVATSPEKRKALARKRDEHLGDLLGQLSESSEVLRTWADQIAVCLAAADVACLLVPDMMPEHDTWIVQIKTAWNRLSRETTNTTEQVNPAAAAFGKLVAWIAANRGALQPSKARERVIGNSDYTRPLRGQWIGRIVDAENEDHDDEQIHVVDVLQTRASEEMARAGYSLATLARTWEANGWIESPDAQKARGQWGRSSRVGGVRAMCYRVRLGVGGDDE